MIMEKDPVWGEEGVASLHLEYDQWELTHSTDLGGGQGELSQVSAPKWEASLSLRFSSYLIPS